MENATALSEAMVYDFDLDDIPGPRRAKRRAPFLIEETPMEEMQVKLR